MRSRPGVTLLELLVVMAIVGSVLALTLAGVQKARAASARAACSNKARQIGLAHQGYHAATGRLPPGLRGGGDPQPFLTWSARLLPYLEQEPAWRETVEDFQRQRLFSRPIPHRNLSRPMPLFVCPADGRAAGTNDEGETVGLNHYLGVSASFGALADGLLFKDSAVRFADVRDGTSQTLLVGERPPSADLHFGWWYAGVGQANQDGSVDSVLATREYNRTPRASTCQLGPYSFGPGNPEDMCSTFHFWSRHDGGAHFLFADGSVRFLAYSADSVMPALATRAGGETVALPD